MPGTALTISEQGAVTIAEFAQETTLDETGVSLVREQLFDLVATSPTRRLVIDMSGVMFASSVALGFLVTVHLKAARAYYHNFIEAVAGNDKLAGKKGLDFWRVWEGEQLFGRLVEADGLKAAILAAYREVEAFHGPFGP